MPDHTHQVKVWDELLNDYVAKHCICADPTCEGVETLRARVRELESQLRDEDEAKVAVLFSGPEYSK